MMTPATRPETTAPKTPQVMKSRKIRNSSAISTKIELPSVPVSRLRSSCRCEAPSLQRTSPIPRIERIVPNPATIIGERTSFVACSASKLTLWAATAAPSAAVARIEPQ